MNNRYGVSFGGPWAYGPQPGMTSGDTIGRYLPPKWLTISKDDGRSPYARMPKLRSVK